PARGAEVRIGGVDGAGVAAPHAGTLTQRAAPLSTPGAVYHRPDRQPNPCAGGTMDEELRRKICRLVAGIVVTDDDLDPREERFIDRLLEGFGIPVGERDLIFPIVDAEDAAAAMRQLPPDARDEAMRLLLDAACADDQIVDE